MVLLEAVAVILVVDFVSGLVHWTEDTFWTERTPIVGGWIVAPNTLHHKDGSAFLANSWLKSSWDLLACAVVLVLAAAAMGMLCWQVWLFAAIGANANQIHKWSHVPAANVPLPVRWLQRLRILQSFEHHSAHHRGDKNSRYCVVTNVVNPVLDGTRFWRLLERVLVPVCGAPRREDLIVRRDPPRCGTPTRKGAEEPCEV